MKARITNELRLDKIDVIIPAYNSYETLDRCLNSICMQTVVNDVTVTIVDDCSTGKGYSYLKERYGKLVDINILRLDQNGGPGVARQYGINHTSNPLITFIDADDTFATAYALDSMRKMIYRDYQNTIAAWASFMEECSNGEFIPHYYTATWMFGKMYKRKFLNESGIHFHPTSRYNEDVGFNAQVSLLSNSDTKKIVVDKNIVYYWMTGEKTITRNYGDVDDYWDNNCLIGYAENYNWVLQNYCDERVSPKQYVPTVINVMTFLWLYYTRAFEHKAYKIQECAEACRTFYNETFSQFENVFTYADKAQAFHVAVANVDRVNPYISFDEFLLRLKNNTLKNDITW